VQVRGFNGFSYADVADKLGVTKATLHYHFPAKADLGRALVQRYAERFAAALQQIDAATLSAPDGLSSYVGLYTDVLRGRRMCLCGMLAAEYRTLPKPMMQDVRAFFDTNEAWLGRLLAQGREEGTLQFASSTRDTARMIIGTLEGAMLVARPYADVERFEASARTLVQGLSAAALTR
jgi:TetR/AcrR family transcriptional repressor of nem operon